MKRVLIFSPYFVKTSKSKGFLGGMPLQAYFYAKKYREDGYEVKLVTLRMEQSLKRELFEGVEIVRVGRVDGRVKLNIEHLRQLVERYNPDIYLHFYSKSGMGEEVLGLLPNLKQKLQAECFVRFGRSDDVCGLSLKSVESLEGVTSILVNRTMVESLIRKTPNASYVLMENLVDKGIFYPKKNDEKKSLREKYLISEKCFVVLYVGRFVETKGVCEIISVLESISSKSDVLGVFVGGDESDKLKGNKGYLDTLKELEMKFPKRFKVIQSVDHDDMPEIYNLANVFCLPSKVEGLSNALLEAQACGLNLLVSDIPENMLQGAGVITNLEKQILDKYKKFKVAL